MDGEYEKGGELILTKSVYLILKLGQKVTGHTVPPS